MICSTQRYCWKLLFHPIFWRLHVPMTTLACPRQIIIFNCHTSEVECSVIQVLQKCYNYSLSHSLSHSLTRSLDHSVTYSLTYFTSICLTWKTTILLRSINTKWRTNTFLNVVHVIIIIIYRTCHHFQTMLASTHPASTCL